MWQGLSKENPGSSIRFTDLLDSNYWKQRQFYLLMYGHPQTTSWINIERQSERRTEGVSLWDWMGCFRDKHCSCWGCSDCASQWDDRQALQTQVCGTSRLHVVSQTDNSTEQVNVKGFWHARHCRWTALARAYGMIPFYVFFFNMIGDCQETIDL